MRSAISATMAVTVWPVRCLPFALSSEGHPLYELAVGAAAVESADKLASTAVARSSAAACSSRSLAERASSIHLSHTYHTEQYTDSK